MNAQVIQGHWDEIKGQLKSRWGNLTDDDLKMTEGNIDQVIGRIQKKTGQSREAIEEYLDRLTSEGAGAISAATERFQQAAHYASDRLREGYDQVSDDMGYRYDQARSMVRDNPMQSVGTAFGIGVLVGVTLGVLLRR